MSRLAYEYANSDENFHQFSIVPEAGFAPELCELFTSAANMFDDLPQTEPEGPQDLQPDVEPFNFPDNVDIDEQPDYDLPEEFPSMGGDISMSPPHDGPEVRRNDSSIDNQDIPLADPDSHFSIEDIKTPSDAPSGETMEEYLPHVSFSKRTSVMHKFLEKSFDNAEDDDKLSYQTLVEGKKRSTAAQTFFELLVLKSRDIISLEQNEPYGEIFISKTDKFTSLE